MQQCGNSTFWCVGSSVAHTRADPLREIRTEQTLNIALNILPGYVAAIPEERAVGFSQNGGKGVARVAPLVDDLLENASVGMLRDEAGSEHFDPLPRNLFDNGRIVQEPPAPEGHEVIEFTGIHAQFVLILATKYTYQEAVAGEIPAKTFQ